MDEEDPIGSVRFGTFEVDFQSGEFRKAGIRVKLQDQPLRILRILLAKQGQVVTREELRQRIWPGNTFVEFDHGLYTAITKLREALGDSSENPRFIETFHRRGYRFIAPVESISGASRTDLVPRESISASRQGESRTGRSRRSMWVAAILFTTALTAVLVVRGVRERQLNTSAAYSIRSIAVLPLENLSHDPEQDYLADGMTDALITDLAKISSLRVISRTSVMQYKSVRKSLPEISRELNVDAVIEGTVMRSGDRVRVTAQLLHAASDRHLWAEAYERKLQDVFELQNELAQAIVSQVQVNLSPQLQKHPLGLHKVQWGAYDNYLKGRYYSNQRTCASLKRGLQYFEAARDSDPTWALGYVGIGDSNLLMPLYCQTPPESSLTQATTAIKKALEIDDSVAEAHASLGGLYRLEWDFEASARELRQAIQLNPNYATAHHWYALYLLSQGQQEEALAEINRAIELDPLASILGGAKALILFNAHNYPEAIQWCQKGVDFDPKWPWFHFWLGAAYVESGAAGKGLNELRLAHRLDQQRTLLLAGIGYAAARSGKKDEALKILRELKVLSQEKYVSSFDFALLYSGLGERENALKSLARTADERISDYLYYINVLPWFADLRSDPKFLTILHRIGLPPQP